MDPCVVTIAEAAKRLSISVSTIRALRKDGRLPFSRIVGRKDTRGRIVIRLCDLDWVLDHPGEGKGTGICGSSPPADGEACECDPPQFGRKLFDPLGFREVIVGLVVFLNHLGDMPPDVIDKMDAIVRPAFQFALRNIEDFEENLDAVRDSLPEPWKTDERVKAMLDRFEAGA